MSHDPNFEEIGGRWQYQLEDYCKKSNFQMPTFHIFSDRRGIFSFFSYFLFSFSQFSLCLLPVIPLHYRTEPVTPPLQFSNISYCVCRHNKVELKKSNTHRLLTTTGDTDGLFSLFSRRPHCLVQHGQDPRPNIRSTLLVRRTLPQQCQRRRRRGGDQDARSCTT